MVMLGRSPGLQLNDLLGRLGMPGGYVGAQADMLAGNPVGVLRNMQDGYREAALGRGTGRFERIMSRGGALPPFGACPSPGRMLPIAGPICGRGYSGGFQTIDMAAGTPNNFMSRMFNGKRRAGVKLERLLKRNPAARAAFEQSIGGRIVSFGRNDGKFTIQRFPPGTQPIPGFAQNPMAMSAVSSLSGMQHSVLGQLGKLGLIGAGVGGGIGALGGLLGGAMMGNPFGGLMMGGLGGLLSGGLGGLSMGAGMGMGGLGMMGMGGPLGMMGGMGAGMGGLPGLGHGSFGFGGLMSPMGGLGMGSWNPNAMPGRMQNTNPMYERMHQAQVSGVLNDPSLTVEDKVTLMLMLIMKKMDKDIERQAQYINSIQQQQSNRRKKGNTLGKVGTVAGGALGGPAGAKVGGGVGGKMGGGGNSPSIDVETMKLKRLIDKRSQMFDMLRQIIDKYNETAKGIIQSIGR